MDIQAQQKQLEQLKNLAKVLDAAIKKVAGCIPDVPGGVLSFFQTDFKWKLEHNPHSEYTSGYALIAVPITQDAKLFHAWLSGGESPIEIYESIRQEVEYEPMFRLASEDSVFYFALEDRLEAVLSNLKHLRKKMPKLKIEIPIRKSEVEKRTAPINASIFHLEKELQMRQKQKEDTVNLLEQIFEIAQEERV